MKEAVWAVSASMAALVGLLFWLHWGRSKDRFFLYFTAAFWIYAVSALILLTAHRGTENQPSAYILRLLAFVLIIAAIVDKNRPQRAAVDRNPPASGGPDAGG